MIPKEWEHVVRIHEATHPRFDYDRAVPQTLRARLRLIEPLIDALVMECPAADCYAGWTESWQDENGEWQGDERCLTCDGAGIVPRYGLQKEATP